MSENKMSEIIRASIEGVKDFAGAGMSVGEPIVTPSGVTVIPISKVSIGFGCGGSDFPSASPKEMFGGGTGGGVTIQPVAFLVLKGESVRMIQLADKNSVAERVANMVPDAIDTISGIFSKKKTADNVTVEEAEPAIIEKVEETSAEQ